MEYKDYYKTLGVARNASADDIKKAFRALARKHHPDINKEKGAEERFKELNEANDVLSDDEKRKAYDELGNAYQAGQQFRPPPGWGNAQRGRAGGPHGAEDFASYFEDFFGHKGRAGQQRGSAQARGMKMRGEDAQAQVQISLRDVFEGATRSLTLRVPEEAADGQVQMRERTLNVKIPKGIGEGQVIRLKGQGGPGFGGGEAGDLYLEVVYAPDHLYRVEGRDLVIDLPVAPWEAALGASIKTPTPSGSVMLKVPPNSFQGRRLRIKGRGLPGKTEGDLYAVLSIVLPKADTDKAKQAYETIARDLAFDPREAMKE